MAEERGNGHGNGGDPVVTAIHELTAEVRTLHVGQRETNARLESVEQVLRGHGRQLGEVVDRLARLEGEVHEGFADLGQKIESAAERDRHLEESVQQLGERVARLEAQATPSR